MSWSKDQKLIPLVVTGLIALQTTQSPALAQTTEQPAKTESKAITAQAPDKNAASSLKDEAGESASSAEIWQTLVANGEELKSNGDLSGARKQLKQAYQLAKSFESDDVRIPRSAEMLAELLEYKAQYGNAQLLYQEAFELREAKFGEGSPQLSESYYNIGRVQLLAGQYSKARKNLRKALDLKEFSASDETNQQDISLMYILLNLGVLETETGDFEKAEDYLKRSQTIAQHLALHKDNAKIFSQLALISMAEGDFQRAEHQAETSLSMAEKFAKGDTMLECQALDSVAAAQLTRRNFKEAALNCNRSLELKSTELGPLHPLTANSLLTAGLIKIAEKKYNAAIKDFDDAIAIYDNSIGRNHLNYSHALFGRAIAHLKQKNRPASEQDMEQALSLMASSVDSRLVAKYRKAYSAQLGPNFNIIQMFKDSKQSPNTVATTEFDTFGQLLEIAVTDKKSDELIAGIRNKDLLMIGSGGFILIIIIAIAVLIPGVFSRLFPWGRDADDHATMRNKNRNKFGAGKDQVPNQSQRPQTTLRTATETERKQARVWKGRLKTMEKELPTSSAKSSGAYDRIDFKPTPSDGTSSAFSLSQDLSTPVQSEGSNDPYW